MRTVAMTFHRRDTRSLRKGADLAKRTAVVSVAQGLAFLVTMLAAAGTAWAGGLTPYVPKSPDVILQRVPSATDPRVRRFDDMRGELRRRPKDMDLALKLADAYIDYGRSTGDARYLGRALGVIDPWMQSQPAPVPVRVVHATILQSRHFFQAAREELEAILKLDPGNVQARLTLATVAMVQGDYALANHSCVQLAASGGNYLGTLCTAQLRALTGHAQQAYALFSLIENPGPEAPPAVKAYVEGLMADTAKRMGKTDEAEAHYKKALQLTPGDNFLLADYGDFLLDERQPRDVIELVKDYTSSDTSFMRLVFAEAALGSPRTDHDIGEMTARFSAMNQRGSYVYRREQARFVLYLKHDPAHALKLAEQNWTVQRAPKDMRIYLESALAAGKPEAARPVLALLATSHLEDPPINLLVEKINAAMNKTSPVAVHDRKPR